MKCTKCGFNNPENTDICRNCSAPLNPYKADVETDDTASWGFLKPSRHASNGISGEISKDEFSALERDFWPKTENYYDDMPRSSKPPQKDGSSSDMRRQKPEFHENHESRESYESHEGYESHEANRTSPNEGNYNSGYNNADGETEYAGDYDDGESPSQIAGMDTRTGRKPSRNIDWRKVFGLCLIIAALIIAIALIATFARCDNPNDKNAVTITPDEEHPGNYFVKVCAKPGTFLVYENSAGQRQEAEVSKRGYITFTVPVAALLPNEPIESDTFAATPVIYIKNEEDGTLKQIENIEPVTLDVPTLTLNCENGDPIECENGMCLIKGKIVQTAANVFLSVSLNNETVIPEEALPIAQDGSFEKELKFEATGEYNVLIEARQPGYKIERRSLKAIVSEPPDPRKIVEIPDSFVTRAKNSDESIVVNGKAPVGTQIEVKSDDPEFSLKKEPTVDAEGNFSFEVNLPRTGKNYEMTIVATLSGGTVIERPFCVQRQPKYGEFVQKCWAYKGSEINNYANPNNERPFAIKGVISEILEDNDYLKAKLTDSEGNTLIIIYYDHYVGSGKKGQKLEAGQEYLLYGVPMQMSDDGLAEVFIWFVDDKYTP